jgi:hypothetical protein
MDVSGISVNSGLQYAGNHGSLSVNGEGQPTSPEVLKENVEASLSTSDGGSISLQAYGISQAAFNLVDTNHDGKITAAELRSYLRKHPTANQGGTPVAGNGPAGRVGGQTAETSVENSSGTTATISTASSQAQETTDEGGSTGVTISQAVEVYNKQTSTPGQDATDKLPNGSSPQGLDLNV